MFSKDAPRYAVMPATPSTPSAYDNFGMSFGSAMTPSPADTAYSCHPNDPRTRVPVGNFGVLDYERRQNVSSEKDIDDMDKLISGKPFDNKIDGYAGRGTQ